MKVTLSSSESHWIGSGRLEHRGQLRDVGVAQRLAQHEAALEQFHLRPLKHHELGPAPGPEHGPSC